MKLEKSKILSALKNMFLTVLGTSILAFGVAVFIIPFDLIMGGISSIAIIIHKLLPKGLLDINILITIVTWSLFLLGLLFLGKDFALKTLLSSIIFPPAVALFSKLADPKVFGGFFYIQGSEYSEIAVLLAAVFGGLIIGTGCAVAFLGGGSTGGTDIIAFLICKKFKNLKSSSVIFVVDTCTILLGALVMRNLVITLLGVITAFIGAIAIDKIFLGQSQAFIAQIITDCPNEISDKIIDKLERTTTLVDVTGGYSKEKKIMISVSFTMREYGDIMTIVNEFDKYAFINIVPAHQINGEGWTR